MISIGRVRREISRHKTYYRQAGNVRRAKKLEQLKEKRLAVEGQAKLVRLEQKEKARIAKAERTVKSNSRTAKLLGSVKQHVSSGGSAQDRSRAYVERMTGKSSGGGLYFGLAKKEPVKKKRGKTITIRL